MISWSSCIPGLTNRTFRGDIQGFQVSFEYPYWWRVTQIVSGPPGVSISMSSFSSGFVTSQPSGGGGLYADVAALVEHWLSRYSNLPESKVLSRGNSTLGFAEGEELIVSWHYHAEGPNEALPYGKVIDKTVVETNLAVEHNGRIYSFDCLMDANEYERLKPGLDHLISTFRFLD
jgi:hypothetical protein